MPCGRLIPIITHPNAKPPPRLRECIKGAMIKCFEELKGFKMASRWYLLHVVQGTPPFAPHFPHQAAKKLSPYGFGWLWISTRMYRLTFGGKYNPLPSHSFIGMAQRRKFWSEWHIKLAKWMGWQSMGWDRTPKVLYNQSASNWDNSSWVLYCLKYTQSN